MMFWHRIIVGIKWNYKYTSTSKLVTAYTESSIKQITNNNTECDGLETTKVHDAIIILVCKYVYMCQWITYVKVHYKLVK